MTCMFLSMKVGAGCSPRGETHPRLKHSVRLMFRVGVWVEPTGYHLLNTPFLHSVIGRLDACGCSMYSVDGGRVCNTHDGRRLWCGLRSFAIGAGAPTRQVGVTQRKMTRTVNSFPSPAEWILPSPGEWIFASPGKWILPSTGEWIFPSPGKWIFPSTGEWIFIKGAKPCPFFFQASLWP